MGRFRTRTEARPLEWRSNDATAEHAGQDSISALGSCRIRPAPDRSIRAAYAMQGFGSFPRVLYTVRNGIRRHGTGSEADLHSGYGRPEFLSHYLHGRPRTSEGFRPDELRTFGRPL